MALNIDSRFNENDDKWEFKLSGELDIYTSAHFKEEVLRLYKSKKQDIVFNGEDLVYVDSTGLGAMIYILKELKDDDYKVYCDNIKPNIRKLFNITDLDKLFIIRGELDE